MSPFGCVRERETAEVLERGQWPHACPEELRAHVESCRVCGELVTVRTVLRAERTAAMTRAVLPSASALWWRAQLRKRNEAIEKMARPIVGAEIFAIAIAAVVALCGLGWALRSGMNPAAWIGSLHFDVMLPFSGTGFQGGLWMVVALLGALAVVGGVVVYFGSEKQ